MEFFYQKDGEYKRINSIVDMDVSLSDEALEMVSAIGNPIEMTFSGEIIDSDGLNAVRKLMSGGDKGIYNGLTLKEEGHLGVDNAWL